MLPWDIGEAKNNYTLNSSDNSVTAVMNRSASGIRNSWMCSFFTSSSPVIPFSCTCVLSHTCCFQRKFSESPNTKPESSFSFGLNLNFLPSSQKNCLNILSPCFSPSGPTKGPFLLQEHEHTAVGLIINLRPRVSVRVNDAFCELSCDQEQSWGPKAASVLSFKCPNSSLGKRGLEHTKQVPWGTQVLFCVVTNAQGEGLCQVYRALHRQLGENRDTLPTFPASRVDEEIFHLQMVWGWVC